MDNFIHGPEKKRWYTDYLNDMLSSEIIIN